MFFSLVRNMETLKKDIEKERESWFREILVSPVPKEFFYLVL